MDILELRKRLHEMLDPLWQTGRYRRDDLYQELSSLLKKDAHVSRMTEQEIAKCAEYLAARTAVAYPCYRCIHHITDINNIPVCAKHIERGNRCERFCASENFRSGTYNSNRSPALG